MFVWADGTFQTLRQDPPDLMAWLGFHFTMKRCLDFFFNRISSDSVVLVFVNPINGNDIYLIDTKCAWVNWVIIGLGTEDDWTKDDLLLIWFTGTSYTNIWIKMTNFSVMKTYLKMSWEKNWLFCSPLRLSSICYLQFQGKYVLIIILHTAGLQHFSKHTKMCPNQASIHPGGNCAGLDTLWHLYWDHCSILIKYALFICKTARGCDVWENCFWYHIKVAWILLKHNGKFLNALFVFQHNQWSICCALFMNVRTHLTENITSVIIKLW